MCLYYGNELQDCSCCGEETLAFVLGGTPVCETCQDKMDEEDEDNG